MDGPKRIKSSCPTLFSVEPSINKLSFQLKHEEIVGCYFWPSADLLRENSFRNISVSSVMEFLWWWVQEMTVRQKSGTSRFQVFRCIIEVVKINVNKNQKKPRKILMIIDIEYHFESQSDFWLSFTKWNNFLWVFWFLATNLAF